MESPSLQSISFLQFHCVRLQQLQVTLVCLFLCRDQLYKEIHSVLGLESMVLTNKAYLNLLSISYYPVKSSSYKWKCAFLVLFFSLKNVLFPVDEIIYDVHMKIRKHILPDSNCILLQLQTHLWFLLNWFFLINTKQDMFVKCVENVIFLYFNYFKSLVRE